MTDEHTIVAQAIRASALETNPDIANDRDALLSLFDEEVEDFAKRVLPTLCVLDPEGEGMEREFVAEMPAFGNLERWRVSVSRVQSRPPSTPGRRCGRA